MMRAANLELMAGQRLLVSDLDWVIEPGQCWCIIGRNGAGKTTLLRTLAGLRQPDRGTLELSGRPLSQWPIAALARARAYLDQRRSDAFSYRVIEVVLSARHPYQDAEFWESDADYQAALSALQALDVADLAERDVRSLSGGERQRVAIAATLAQDTPLLLLDEPANALDLAHQWRVMDLIAALCAGGKTVVIVSHDLNLARAIASHALLLNGDGHWQAGPVGDVMQAPLLSRCLGHPIELLQHEGRTIYVSAHASLAGQERE